MEIIAKEEYNVEVYEGRTVWKNKEGKFHRLDGPAIECSNGDKFWWVNGELHRLDGPAVEWSNGTKSWRVDGKRHRLDGYKEWYINGVLLTEEEFLKRTPTKKVTISEIEDLFGHKVEIVNDRNS